MSRDKDYINKILDRYDVDDGKLRNAIMKESIDLIAKHYKEEFSKSYAAYAGQIIKSSMAKHTLIKIKKEQVDSVINELQRVGYDVFENNDGVTILDDGFSSSFPVRNINSLLSTRTIERDGEMVTFPPLKVKDVVSLMLASFNTKRDIKNGLYD